MSCKANIVIALWFALVITTACFSSDIDLVRAWEADRQASDERLTFTVAASGSHYKVGSTFRLSAVISNRSDRAVVLWMPHHKFDVLIVDSNWGGKEVQYFMPHTVGTHNFCAWSEDIVSLGPRTARTQTWELGRNTPGKLQYRVRYGNRSETLKVEGQAATLSNIWTGVLHSNAVTVEFDSKDDFKR